MSIGQAGGATVEPSHPITCVTCEQPLGVGPWLVLPNEYPKAAHLPTCYNAAMRRRRPR